MSIKVGLDIGIASVGWAVIDSDKQVIDAGVRLFDSADATKNEVRRNNRGIRRLLRRKVHRINRFKRLWEDSGLEIPFYTDVSTVELRNRAINEKVSVDKLYLILLNMLKHRGISYLDDAIDESVTGDYKESLTRNAKLIETKLPCQIQEDRLISHGVYRGNSIVEGKGDKKAVITSNVFTIQAYIKELNRIFDIQSSFHLFLDEEFRTAYLEIFKSKRAYYDGPGNELSRTNYGRYTTNIDLKTGRYITSPNLFEKLIGKCSVYPDKLRASTASYTAQEFNLLNDLNNLRINGDKLTEFEKKHIISSILNEKVMSINDKRFRKYISLAIGTEVEMMTGARVDKDEKEIFHTFEAYRKLCKSLELNNESFDRDTLDDIAYVLTINTDKESIFSGFKSTGLTIDEGLIEQLIEFRRKNGSLFNKWHSFSLDIMKELIPVMYKESKNQMEILTDRGVFKTSNEIYKEYKSIPSELVLKDIFNPVVKRSVNQSLLVLNKIIDTYGYPEDIIVEMAREDNEKDQKKRITDAQSKNEKDLNRIINRIETEYGIIIEDKHYHKHKALKTKLRLWDEQQGICLYCGQPIRINDLLNDTSLFEIDHIIPISISFDDSKNNKVLVYSIQNQLKGNRTPYMYLNGRLNHWNFESYSHTVNQLYKDGNITRNKNMNLLFKENITKEEVVKGFISRNLNDTRYASRVVLNTIQSYMKAHETGTKVKVIRGSFTAQLRNRLHLEKNRDLSFSHHAIDAMVMCYSKMGLDAYKIAQKEIIDYETGEILDVETYTKMSDDDLYERKMFYEGIQDIKQTILEAEKVVKYSHKVDKKVNRQLSNETIYGVRQKADGTNQKISKIKDIYNLNSFEIFAKKMKKDKKGNNKLEEFLMYHHDPKTFEILLKVVEIYKDKPNPFLAYKDDHGEPIRKYSKKGNGPFVTSLKYYDGEVGSCIDISHKYGHPKGSQKIILDSLNPYRTDVYYNE
ncbi:type II CRISPR RNA-guided endonuclease Cas9, partial [Petrocella sp. FN5]|uniref:type II CRISPR RNA-guided endonuclease Cas9 n=1 Tax=Petrocella sp. FN5 TaxID=3032002 RepID=UPI0023DB9FB7